MRRTASAHDGRLVRHRGEATETGRVHPSAMIDATDPRPDAVAPTTNYDADSRLARRMERADERIAAGATPAVAADSRHGDETRSARSDDRLQERGV